MLAGARLLEEPDPGDPDEPDPTPEEANLVFDAIRAAGRRRRAEGKVELLVTDAEGRQWVIEVKSIRPVEGFSDEQVHEVRELERQTRPVAKTSARQAREQEERLAASRAEGAEADPDVRAAIASEGADIIEGGPIRGRRRR
jgi:hypothetical protein